MLEILFNFTAPLIAGNCHINWAFKHQLNKMDKHTQKIRRKLPKNCLSVFDYFMELVLKGLKYRTKEKYISA